MYDVQVSVGVCHLGTKEADNYPMMVHVFESCPSGWTRAVQADPRLLTHNCGESPLLPKNVLNSPQCDVCELLCVVLIIIS